MNCERFSRKEMNIVLNYRGKKRLVSICEKIHKILTPLKSRRFESPSYIRRSSRLTDSPFRQHQSLNQSSLKVSEILVQGSTVKAREKLNNPSNFRNTVRLITKLPLIKPDNI
jgi:hypothetical protein